MNFFKPIGLFLLGLTLFITFPIWLLLLAIGGICWGLADLGNKIWDEFRD